MENINMALLAGKTSGSKPHFASSVYLLSALSDLRNSPARSVICRDIISSRLNALMLHQTDRIARKVSQNMFEVLQEHKEGHRWMEQQRFARETSLFLKSIPNSKPLSV